MAERGRELRLAWLCHSECRVALLPFGGDFHGRGAANEGQDRFGRQGGFRGVRGGGLFLRRFIRRSADIGKKTGDKINQQDGDGFHSSYVLNLPLSSKGSVGCVRALEL